MHIPLTLLLCLFATISPSDASVLSRSSQSVARAAHRIHRKAVRHSAGLARDLRLAFDGIRLEKPPALANSRVYCVGGANTLPNPNQGGPGNNGNNNNATTSRGGSPSPTSSKPGASPTGAPLPPSPWKLLRAYQGNSFFDGWNFDTFPDPTHGQVTYVDQATGRAAGLLEVNSAGNAIMRVETTPTVPATRQSIRITTQQSYTGGLVLMDSLHMPTGCGTWPAFWSNGPNWPAGGEIDILEGVHDYTNNQATIHTNPGCNLNGGTDQFTGTLVGGTNCAADQTGNQGCGIRAADSNSFGAAFNRIGGGVYAMLWDDAGVKIYFFPRSAIPADITGNAPQPTGWGKPMAFWPASGCNPYTFFNSHSAIFDTTLCGDWAGAVWNSAGIPGQEQSCAQRTGSATCEDFVRNNGAAFAEAYWEVAYMKIYQLP